MITECQTAHVAQIWYQNVRFNLPKNHVINTGFYTNVIEIKRLIEMNSTRINAAHVIVEIITG